MVGNEKVIDLPFTNCSMLYESWIAIVAQCKLEVEQFFLYLRSSNFDYEFVSDDLGNKEE